MQTINPETTIGDIVRAIPARARVFENLGIDYCCGGKKPLAEVCKAKGLDPATVVAMLAALDDIADTSVVDVDLMSLSELCNHIEEVHHSFLKQELPRLDFMTRKVAAVHGEHESRLLEIRNLFETFKVKLLSHTQEEDEEIFPAIRKLEAAAPGDAAALAADLKGKLGDLEHEHEGMGAVLERFHTLTDNYTPPEWACNTFRALYDSLGHLAKETFQHVHKENNVLFPKALARA